MICESCHAWRETALCEKERVGTAAQPALKGDGTTASSSSKAPAASAAGAAAPRESATAASGAAAAAAGAAAATAGAAVGAAAAAAAAAGSFLVLPCILLMASAAIALQGHAVWQSWVHPRSPHTPPIALKSKRANMHVRADSGSGS
jgi:hypothetical protein